MTPGGPGPRETWAEANNSSVNSVLAVISNPRPSGGGFLIHHGIGDVHQNLHYYIGDIGDKLALSWTGSGLFLEEANGYIDLCSTY